MKKTTYLCLNLCRAAVKFICFLGVFAAVNTLFMRFTEQFNEENRSGWSLAILLFVAVSVSWVFYHFNKRAQARFSQSRHASENGYQTSHPIHALRSLDLWSDTLVCSALSLVSPFLFRFTDMEKFFFENTNIHPTVQKILIGILIGILFFAVQWFTVYDVRRKWARSPEISSKNEFLMIAAYLIFITVMYAVGFYIAMAYVPGLSVYAFLFKELFLEILIVLAILFLLVYFNRIRKRRKFLSALKKATSDAPYELSKIEKPYLSVFAKIKGASFILRAHGKTYQCKLISGKRKGVPIIFTDQGFLLYRRIVRIGKSELFSIYSKYDYSFQSDVKKCLIVTCIPAQCYFKDASGHMRKIDTGEKIGEYTVYSAQGFLGALDRDCLDR